MKAKIILLSIATAILITINGCKKYPEGPVISLRTKTERVANNWKVAQALDNGNDVTSDYIKYELALTKTGSASLTAKYKILGIDFDYTTDGTWVFASNKEKISFDFDNNSSDGVYKILKLKEDEMWLKEDAGNVELHLVTR
jgi:hypothetical protein